MSKYKEALKQKLKEMSLLGEAALSIGAQSHDLDYFKSADIKHKFTTLDIDPEFKPTIEWNINRPVFDDDNEFRFHDHRDSYDYVLALNLWEYIYDPVTAHRNMHFFLKPNGTYIGSYLFVYGKHNPAGTDFLRYTDDGIRKLLTLAFFKDIQIDPINCSDLLETFYATEGMRVRKDVDHNVAGYLVTAKK